MPEEPLDQDSQIVQEVQQTATNHGWLILPSDAIELITEVKQALAAYDQRQTQVPPPIPVPPVQSAPVAQPMVPTGPVAPTPPIISNHERVREAEKYIRAALPDRIHNPDGGKPEIPDDLYEEMAAILADHHTT